jgi:putative endonuclease
LFYTEIMKISNPTAVLGEDLAVEFLKKKGYTILERNYRKRYGEIDIIAVEKRDGISRKEGKIVESLVFIEVKTRRTAEYGTPLEAIGRGKLRELTRTAQFYKLSHKGLPDLMRIDAISIVLNHNDNKSIIEHVENISI